MNHWNCMRILFLLPNTFFCVRLLFSSLHIRWLLGPVFAAFLFVVFLLAQNLSERCS
jgi:hypothetical protein